MVERRKKARQRPDDRQAADERRHAQQEALKVQVAAALEFTKPADIAEACKVSVAAVSGWKTTGKVATEMLLPLAKAIGCRVDDLLTKGAPLRPLPDSTFEGPPPSVEQAVEVLTLVLAAASPVERAVTRGAFEGFLIDPREGQKHLTKVMLEIAGANPSPPTPAPPEDRPGRRREAVAERKPQPARLSVVPGDGQRSQLALPLRRALSPRRNPFDESNASWDERQHYEKWTKKSPRAANG